MNNSFGAALDLAIYRAKHGVEGDFVNYVVYNDKPFTVLNELKGTNPFDFEHLYATLTVGQQVSLLNFISFVLQHWSQHNELYLDPLYETVNLYLGGSFAKVGNRLWDGTITELYDFALSAIIGGAHFPSEEQYIEDMDKESEE